MGIIAKTINSFKPLTIFAKVSILDVLQGSEYHCTKNEVFHLKKYLMENVRLCKHIWIKESLYKKDQRFFHSFFLTLIDVHVQASPQ